MDGMGDMDITAPALGYGLERLFRFIITLILIAIPRRILITLHPL